MSTEKPGSLLQGREGLNLAKALRDSLGCGVVLIDANGKVSAVSSEAAKILGLEGAQMLNASVEVLPIPLPGLAREVLSSGRPLSSREIELKPRGRAQLSVRVSALPLQAGKANSGLVIVLGDLAAIREMERHLEQLNRLADVGTLAATMAHEIKNALVAGKTFIDLLLEKNRDSELAEVVRRELGRIDSIVGRMLNFANPTPAAFRAVHLHEVLEHSLRLVQPQMESQHISLDRSFKAASDLVRGDDYELQQAFVNLLLNALEAMGPDGKLTVSTRSLSEEVASANLRETAQPLQVRVAIRDTGAGILPENLGRLFEPFFTTKPNGTGLGLAITRRIIQEHHGAITADSRVGQGTTFSIVLPAL